MATRSPAVSTTALGKRIPVVLSVMQWSVAPDWLHWLPPYLLTAIATAAVIGLTSDLWSYPEEHLLAVAVVLAHNLSALVLLLGDPGIYPRHVAARATPPTKDTSGTEGPAYCRTCELWRPARTSHCYTCGVCVLEHDHHCTLIGACIGKRSLRWFVCYLLTMVVQLCVGMAFLVRSFRRVPLEKDWKKMAPPAGTDRWTSQAITSFENQATMTLLAHLAAIGLIGVLLVPVTIGTVVYVVLPLTNTTWREARSGLRLQLEERPKPLTLLWRVRLLPDQVARVIRNVKRMCDAGPSHLAGPGAPADGTEQ